MQYFHVAGTCPLNTLLSCAIFISSPILWHLSYSHKFVRYLSWIFSFVMIKRVILEMTFSPGPKLLVQTFFCFGGTTFLHITTLRLTKELIAIYLSTTSSSTSSSCWDRGRTLTIVQKIHVDVFASPSDKIMFSIA